MKKTLLSLLLCMLAVVGNAQNDVTKFLGIPVDGYKADMKQKLISKGFTPQKVNGVEYLEGEFNGANVHVFIATNNNKVCRIMLCDVDTQDEANIKIRFNKLVRQFENNKRYIHLDDYTLSETEDISYGMIVNKKIYEAQFYQVPDLDLLMKRDDIKQEFLKKFTSEQISNPTEEIYQEMQKLLIAKEAEVLLKKFVWFRISEIYGKYYITMYYDNEYNKANGEDL